MCVCVCVLSLCLPVTLDCVDIFPRKHHIRRRRFFFFLSVVRKHFYNIADIRKKQLLHRWRSYMHVLTVWFCRACGCWWTPGTSWASAGRAARTRSRACWWCRGKDAWAARGWSQASFSCTWWRWARSGLTPAYRRPTHGAPSSNWWVDWPHYTWFSPLYFTVKVCFKFTLRTNGYGCTFLSVLHISPPNLVDMWKSLKTSASLVSCVIKFLWVWTTFCSTGR